MKLGHVQSDSSSSHVALSEFRTTSRAPDATRTRMRPPRALPLIETLAATERGRVILKHEESPEKGGMAATKEDALGKTPPDHELGLDHRAPQVMALSTTMEKVVALHGRTFLVIVGLKLGGGTVGAGVGAGFGTGDGITEGTNDGSGVGS